MYIYPLSGFQLYIFGIIIIIDIRVQRRVEQNNAITLLCVHLLFFAISITRNWLSVKSMQKTVLNIQLFGWCVAVASSWTTFIVNIFSECIWMSDVWEIERTSPGNLLWLCGHEKCLYVIIVDSYRYLQTKCFWFISGVSIQPMTQFTTISLFKYFVNIWIKLLAQIWTKLESTQTEVERR